MKKLKEILLLFLIGGMIVFTSGCGKTRESITQECLKNKYDEEFNVYSISSQGNVYYAICSPKNNPDIVFKARMCGDYIDTDDYNLAKIANNINEIMKNDLKELFPDAYFRTEYNSFGTTIYIYFDKDKGTSKQYQKEYSYFSEEVDKYINQGIMTEPVVVFFKVDNETLDKLGDYYKIHENRTSLFFFDYLGIDYARGDETNLGNPPNVSICFWKKSKVYIGDLDNYMFRRELIENE